MDDLSPTLTAIRHEADRVKVALCEGKVQVIGQFAARVEWKAKPDPTESCCEFIRAVAIAGATTIVLDVGTVNSWGLEETGRLHSRDPYVPGRSRDLKTEREIRDAAQRLGQVAVLRLAALAPSPPTLHTLRVTAPWASWWAWPI